MRTDCPSTARDGRIQVAAVYDPNRQELFTAERGQGAFLNGTPLKVSQAAEMVDALLVTGFPYDVQTRTDDIVGLFGRFLGRARAVRRLGSAALDLCYIAAGRMDGFWEQDLKPWDVAAGMLLVEEAGGRVTGFDGAAFSPYGANIVASNGLLHQQMLDVIAGVPREPTA
jgi:myo-inositol-1(or 4)-monophosphatase